MIFGRPVLDAETAKELAKQDKCMHCGGYHLRACPRVKRLVFRGIREIAEVEFWERWSDEGIVWPEDVQAALPEEEVAANE